jgi:hypothetical protein
MENNMGLPKKLNIDLPYDPAIPLQRHLHTHVYCSAIHNSQVMETAKISHY